VAVCVRVFDTAKHETGVTEAAYKNSGCCEPAMASSPAGTRTLSCKRDRQNVPQLCPRVEVNLVFPEIYKICKVFSQPFVRA